MHRCTTSLRSQLISLQPTCSRATPLHRSPARPRPDWLESNLRNVPCAVVCAGLGVVCTQFAKAGWFSSWCSLTKEQVGKRDRPARCAAARLVPDMLFFSRHNFRLKVTHERRRCAVIHRIFLPSSSAALYAAPCHTCV